MDIFQCKKTIDANPFKKTDQRGVGLGQEELATK
jgi:hypothetical protein